MQEVIAASCDHLGRTNLESERTARASHVRPGEPELLLVALQSSELTVLLDCPSLRNASFWVGLWGLHCCPGVGQVSCLGILKKKSFGSKVLVTGCHESAFQLHFLFL